MLKCPCQVLNYSVIQVFVQTMSETCCYKSAVISTAVVWGVTVVGSIHVFVSMSYCTFTGTCRLMFDTVKALQCGDVIGPAARHVVTVTIMVNGW